jgi:hypothetical protein
MMDTELAQTDENQPSKNTILLGRMYQRYHPRETNWQHGGSALRAWIGQFVSGLDIPYRSIAIFTGSWLLLEMGWPLLTLLGVASAGTVWAIPAMIPCVFIGVYTTLIVSGVNMVRSIVIQLGSQRDNIMKSLFRGYFWGLLSIGLSLIIHIRFIETSPQLFALPIIYFIPFEVAGVTVPVPIPLGRTGIYNMLAVTIIVYAVGITSSCIGGLELLRTVIESTRKHGFYGSLFAIMFLAVFPALNVYLSSLMLETVLDILGRWFTFAV